MEDISVAHQATFVNLGFGTELSDLGSSTRAGHGYSTFPSFKSLPVTYSWSNIEVYAEEKRASCFTRSPQVPKKILKNVSGCVGPGEFLALMGASGAGKTTLLNCLTFRNTGKLKITGQRHLNGEAVDIDMLARHSGYVQQNDLFIPTLTVKEHLKFQALLRMDGSFSYDERMKRVNEAIQELGLAKCADTVIGHAVTGIKGISGGERKRLAFASETLTNPSLIFCDEPTSGLDSFMANNIIQVLKKIALTGKTVVCSIHQPSSDVFDLFDRIFLMAEGRTAFFGPVSDAKSFFLSRGLPCPSNYNPADFYIQTLATVPGEEVESKKKINEICDAFESSEANRLVLATAKINSRQINRETNELTGSNVQNSLYKVSWFAQFKAVLWRSLISVVREPTTLKVKMFQTICIAAMVALIFQGHVLQYVSIRNIQGGILILLSNATFIHIYGVVTVITNEIPIVLREHRMKMYRTDVYFLCKTLADLPADFIFPFIFTLITYHAIGLNVLADRFFIACGIMILVTNAVTSFGYFVSCLISSTENAINSVTPLVTPLLYIGGFYIQNSAVPAYLDWMRYLSWFMYGNEALSINQWVGVQFNDTACPDSVCIGEDILKDYDYNPDFYYRDIIGLCGLIVGFRVLAFFALLRKTYWKD
ncbi:protein white-like [Daphnia carinata]|uniref:protein white-like n=1 Tax=Daphnia carinata TaxID=120202 RepID=UPI00257B20DE|nr:protein white-like [Daphnia carinata]